MKYRPACLKEFILYPKNGGRVPRNCNRRIFRLGYFKVLKNQAKIAALSRHHQHALCCPRRVYFGILDILVLGGSGTLHVFEITITRFECA